MTKTLLGHLCLDTLLANLFLGALLGDSCLVKHAWEPAGNLAEPGLGRCAWETGTFGNLRAPLPANLACKRFGTWLGTWLGWSLVAPTCSGTFTMPEDPELMLLGTKAGKIKISYHVQWASLQTNYPSMSSFRSFPWKLPACPKIWGPAFLTSQVPMEPEIHGCQRSNSDNFSCETPVA